MFIAHSLGGIIVKKVMILAHERMDIYGGLRDKAKAFIFLGVPHRGADAAFWLDFVVELSKITQLGFKGNNRFVDALKANSPTFAAISTQSNERFQSPLISIRTFYESEKMGNLTIVDKTSAVLGLVNEVATQISGTNHSTICKFKEVDQQTYRPVWQQILRIAEENLRALAVSNSHTRKAGDLGPSFVPDYADRWQVLFADKTLRKDPTIGDFSEPYPEPPRVLVSLSHLDFNSDCRLRVRASVSEVTPVSFRPLFETWDDTKCQAISGHWLEIAPGDSDIQTGRRNLFGIDKSRRIENWTHLNRRVDFYTPYAETPKVLCWLVHIESSERTNHRMIVEPQNVTNRGFDLQFSTWHDTEIYELEAEWMAFSPNRSNIHVLPVIEVGSLNWARTVDFEFPPNKFQRQPACFLALSSLDTETGANLRVKVSVASISKTKVSIKFDTWGNSFTYMVRFQGLAIL